MPKRVVMVEDDSTVQAVLYELLTEEGYCVEQAIDGEQALTVLQEQCPDLILLDLGLPVMDGVSFLQTRQIRQTCTQVPVLVITAQIERLGGDGEVLGVSGVILKPFDVDDVIGRVAQLTAAAG